MVPGRGAHLSSPAACSEAIALTQEFLRTLLESVRASCAAGASLKQSFEAAERAMVPRFGQWPVFQHVLPFDVARVYDELHGVEHPRVWTAERDRELWQVLRGRDTA